MTMAEMFAGAIGGHEVQFQAPHRDGNDSPAAVQVSLTVPMSYEDIVAALYIVVTGGMTLHELTNDAYLRRMVVETLLSEDSGVLQTAQATVADAKLGTAEYALAQDLRARVVEVFAPTSAPAQRRGLCHGLVAVGGGAA